MPTTLQPLLNPYRCPVSRNRDQVRNLDRWPVISEPDSLHWMPDEALSSFVSLLPQGLVHPCNAIEVLALEYYQVHIETKPFTRQNFHVTTVWDFWSKSHIFLIKMIVKKVDMDLPWWFVVLWLEKMVPFATSPVLLNNLDVLDLHKLLLILNYFL